MAAAKKQYFLRFLYFTESSPPSSIQSPRFTNDYEFFHWKIPLGKCFFQSLAKIEMMHKNRLFGRHFETVQQINFFLRIMFCLFVCLFFNIII